MLPVNRLHVNRLPAHRSHADTAFTNQPIHLEPRDAGYAVVLYLWLQVGRCGLRVLFAARLLRMRTCMHTCTSAAVFDMMRTAQPYTTCLPGAPHTCNRHTPGRACAAAGGLLAALQLHWLPSQVCVQGALVLRASSCHACAPQPLPLHSRVLLAPLRPPVLAAARPACAAAGARRS